jgi:hypothetical protein
MNIVHILLIEAGEDDLQVKNQSFRQPAEHPIHERVLVYAREKAKRGILQLLSMEHVMHDGADLRFLEISDPKRRGT